jgi:hypothetical protein
MDDQEVIHLSVHRRGYVLTKRRPHSDKQDVLLGHFEKVLLVNLPKLILSHPIIGRSTVAHSLKSS